MKIRNHVKLNLALGIVFLLLICSFSCINTDDSDEDDNDEQPNKKIKVTETNNIPSLTINYADMSVKDWNALSKEVLQLHCNNFHIHVPSSSTSRKAMAEKLFEFFNGGPSHTSTSSGSTSSIPNTIMNTRGPPGQVSTQQEPPYSFHISIANPPPPPKNNVIYSQAPIPTTSVQQPLSANTNTNNIQEQIKQLFDQYVQTHMPNLNPPLPIPQPFSNNIQSTQSTFPQHQFNNAQLTPPTETPPPPPQSVPYPYQLPQPSLSQPQQAQPQSQIQQPFPGQPFQAPYHHNFSPATKLPAIPRQCIQQIRNDASRVSIIYQSLWWLTAQPQHRVYPTMR